MERIPKLAFAALLLTCLVLGAAGDEYDDAYEALQETQAASLKHPDTQQFGRQASSMLIVAPGSAGFSDVSLIGPKQVLPSQRLDGGLMMSNEVETPKVPVMQPPVAPEHIRERSLIVASYPPSYPPPSSPPSYPPPASSPPPPTYPATDPCGICQDCIAQVYSGVSQAAFADQTLAVTDVADSLLTVCTALSVDDDVCSAAYSSILDDVTVAYRPALICDQLALCLPADVADCTDITNAATTGTVDECSSTGVYGGSVGLPAQPSSVGKCTDDDQCTDVQLCLPDTPEAEICTCADGATTCLAIGTCTSYCDLPDTQTDLAALQAQFQSCAVDGDCGAGQVCLDYPGCQTWTCDSTLQELVGTDCTKACVEGTPSLSAAQLSNDGTYVTVTLSMAAQDVTECSTVFDATTAAKLGEDAECDVDAKTLTIYLSPDATLVPGDSLTLSATTELLDEIDRPFGGAAVTVATCTTCLTPTASLLGTPLLVAPCAVTSDLSLPPLPTIFDASASADPSGRPFASVVWSKTSGPASTDLATAISASNSASGTDKLSLVLQPTQVAAMADGTYVIKVVVTSWLGTSAQATYSFVVNTAATAPSISIVGGSQKFSIPKGIKLAAALDSASACPGNIVVWSWSILGKTYTTQEVNIPGPVAAVHGQTYTVTLTGNIQGQAGTSTVTAVLTAVGSAPAAMITGDSGDVLNSALAVLDARASVDPTTGLAGTAASSPLTYKWDCTRMDNPNIPCFSTATQGDQTSTPGKWTVPMNRLTLNVVHQFTVTVSKPVLAGASPLQATARVQLRPRDATVAFPRGTLTRVCSLFGCSPAHNTNNKLQVALTLVSGYEAASVQWSSVDISTLASTTALDTTGAAVRPLTIDSTLLPLKATVTIKATMTLNGVTGEATVVVPLNRKPYCGAAGGACLTLSAVGTPTFPSEAITGSAVSFGDFEDGTALKYEFGVYNASDAVQYTPRQVGKATSYTFSALGAGTFTLYACAIDSFSARVCATANTTVAAASGTFNASAALTGLNPTTLAGMNDKNSLLIGARQTALLAASLSSGGTLSAADSAAIAASSLALVNAVASATVYTDPEQAKQGATAIAGMAASSSGTMSDSSRTSLLNNANAAAAALSGGPSAVQGGASLGKDYVSTLCSVLSSALASSSTASSGRRLQQASDATALTQVQTSTTVGGKLVAGLIKDAKPCGSQIPSGSNGVFISVAATCTAGVTTATVSAGTSATSTSSSSTPAGHRRLHALATDATATVVGSSLSGTSVQLQYYATIGASVASALGTSALSGATIVSGLANVAVMTTATPAVAVTSFGASGYVQLQIPVSTTTYSTSKATACISYSATTNTITGLDTTTTSSTFVSYDASTGLVTCKLTTTGSYMVVQYTAPATPGTSPGGSKGDSTSSPSPSPSPSPPAGDVTLTFTITFQMDYSQLLVNNTMATFKTQTIAAVANLYNVAVSKVSILWLRAGSVIVGLSVTVPSTRASGTSDIVSNPAGVFGSSFTSTYGISGYTGVAGGNDPGYDNFNTPPVSSPPPSSSSGLSGGAIAGIVVGCVVGTALLAMTVLLVARHRRAMKMQVVVSRTSQYQTPATPSAAGGDLEAPPPAAVTSAAYFPTTTEAGPSGSTPPAGEVVPPHLEKASESSPAPPYLPPVGQQTGGVPWR